jgi:hypothetical protein
MQHFNLHFNFRMFVSLVSISILVLCSSAVAQTDHPQAMTVGGGVNPVTLTANGTDSYAGALPRAILSYQPRACYIFSPDVTNTGAASLAIDGLAAKAIVRQDGSALADGDLGSGMPYVVCYVSTTDNLVAIGIRAAGSGGGGGGDPGGSTGQLQYNNGGTFGGLTGSAVSGSRLSLSGRLDVGSGSGFRPPSGTTLPASCEVGEQFFKTDADVGKNSYGCTAANTWTLQGDGGGSDGGGLGCASGPGVHIPAIGGPSCAKGSTEEPWAWGGLDFPNPASSGTSVVNLDAEVPPDWNGQAPDAQITYSRPSGTFTAGNKFLMSVKTWYLPDAAVVGSESNFSDPNWGAEVLNDVSPTGSDVLGIDQKYTTTVRSLDLGTAPNAADPRRTMMIQLQRQASGAGGRTDTLPAPIRVQKVEIRWSTGTKTTTTTGSVSSGATSVPVVNGVGVISSTSQRVIIVGAGAAGANYIGTISSTAAGTVPAATFTITPATSTTVPTGTLVIFESVNNRVFNFAGTGPDSAGGGSGLTGNQLVDDVRQWATTNGTSCNISGVNLPTSPSATCVVNAGSDPESGIQFPDNSSATNCVYLRAKSPPNWDSTSAPSLLLTGVQVGSGTSNILMKVGTRHIAEGSTYNSTSYTVTNCTVRAAVGDMGKFTVTCPDLSIAGAGAGRALKMSICRAGADALDTSTLPIRFFESSLRWTVTSACPAP